MLHIASHLWMNILARYVNCSWLGGGVGGKQGKYGDYWRKKGRFQRDQRPPALRNKWGGGAWGQMNRGRWEGSTKRLGRWRKTRKGHLSEDTLGRSVGLTIPESKGSQTGFHSASSHKSTALQINSVHLYCRFSHFRRPFVQAPRWAAQEFGLSTSKY